MEVEGEGLAEAVGVVVFLERSPEFRMIGVDNAVMVGAKDHDVLVSVVQGFYKGSDMMCVHDIDVSVAFGDSLAANLTPVAVQLLEIVAYIAVKSTDFTARCLTLMPAFSSSFCQFSNCSSLILSDFSSSFVSRKSTAMTGSAIHTSGFSEA